MSTRQILKVGVIGLGMGSGHVRNFQSHPNAEVVAIADVDKDKLESKGIEPGIGKRYTDPLKMIKEEKLDIVTVAVPNKFHKTLTIAALEAGSHVLCEKPMAMNTKEAEEMLAVAKKFRKHLMINFSSRFSPQSFALKKEVESGILGKIYYARTVWMRRRGIPGFDLGVHRLDLAHWLMDYPKPVWVLANTFNHITAPKANASGKIFDVEDMGVASIRFDNGAMLTLEASWAGNTKKNEEIETRLFGSEGGMRQFYVCEGSKFEAELYIERNGSQYDMILHAPSGRLHPREETQHCDSGRGCCRNENS